MPVWMTMTVAAEPISGAKNATPVTYMAPSAPPNHIHHGFWVCPVGTVIRNDGLVIASRMSNAMVPTTKEMKPAWMAEPSTFVSWPLTATWMPKQMPTPSPTKYQMGDGEA